MDSLPAGEELAVRLAAHWRAILLSHPHQMRLSELVRRQLPLMTAALGRREIAVPFRVQEMDDMFRPKEVPEHFVVGTWTLHADLDAGREWACAMIAMNSGVIQRSYIDQGRPNLFHEPYAWAQAGVHENVQDNFRLRSYALMKIRDIFGEKPFWYDAALGAHIISTFRLAQHAREVDEDDVQEHFQRWAAEYEIERSWQECNRLAHLAAREHIETPCQVIPLNVVAGRQPGLSVQEAIWEYLADPGNGFGLSHRRAAELMRVSYGTLSSRRSHRKNGRTRLGSTSRSALTGDTRGADTTPAPEPSGTGGDDRHGTRRTESSRP